jgi:hypothetical protein
LSVVDALNYPVCLTEWDAEEEEGDDYNAQINGDVSSSTKKMKKKPYSRLSTQQDTLFSNIQSAMNSFASPSEHYSHFFSENNVDQDKVRLSSAGKGRSLYIGNENEKDFMFQPCTQLWTEGKYIC